MKTILLALLLALPLSTRADERILSREAFQAMGFQPVRHERILAEAPELPRGLPWPVRFEDGAHNVAQNYVNYQLYGWGNAYFHGGCDLRSPGGGDVVATASGTLEGGYYGYVENEDGSMEKEWNPWKGQSSHDPYFELAIVTDDGYRFEYHHVDSENLPASTIAALNKGHVRVEAGTVIGKVNGWAFRPYRYDHIHYNIIAPDGTRMNPEYYSQAVADHTAPNIRGVYGLAESGRVIPITENSVVDERLKEVVVATTESHDGDAYVQTPPYASLQFTNSGFAWDFRRTLTSEGAFPDIRKVFLDELRLPNGQSLSTSGQYGKGLFLMRLPVSTASQGAFTVTVGDTAENMSTVHASYEPR